MPDYEKLYYALFSDLSRIIDILEIVRQNAETRFLAAVEEGEEEVLFFASHTVYWCRKKEDLPMNCRLCAFCCALALAFSLSACSGDKPITHASPTPALTVRFPHAVPISIGVGACSRDHAGALPGPHPHGVRRPGCRPRRRPAPRRLERPGGPGLLRYVPRHGLPPGGL